MTNQSERIGANFDRYAALFNALRTRTIARLASHDRALGGDMGMHLAHNWYVCQPGKNPAIELIMRRHDALARALHDRKNRHFKAIVRATGGGMVSTVAGWEQV